MKSGSDQMADESTELMHEGLVRKDMAQLRVKPNLQYYEQLRKTFRWEDAEKEVDWFPGGKINSAYNAIDRHAKGSRKRSRSSTMMEKAVSRNSLSGRCSSRRTSLLTF